jgi:hypothetical protein
VKSCSTNFGAIFVQGFVARGLFGGEFPRMVVQSGPVAYTVDNAFWKAYGAKCTLGGVHDWVYKRLGAPATEDEPLTSVDSVQYFSGGNIIRFGGNPNNIQVRVSLASGAECWFNNVLDSNNDPCFTVNGDIIVNIADLAEIGAAISIASAESQPLWNDRFDVNRDGFLNPADLGLTSSQFSTVCT